MLRALVLAATLAAFTSTDAGAAAEQSPTAATARASKSDSLAEVTISAKRAELARRVSKFVNEIAAQENGGDGGLARWQAPPMCPLVAGLPRQEGEFILERLSEIARAAGAPLAGDHCAPNLYVLVTTQPEALLRAMEKRNRPFTFGYDVSYHPPIETPARVVDAFIKTPGAVRVWYDSNEKDPWGQPLAYCQASSLDPQQKATRPPSATASTQYFPCSHAVAGGSHISFNNIWTFSRVFVVVDRTRLRDVKIGQLADYVAMVGLAKLKPGAPLGDAPTILKLFDGAPEAAPVGMTDWDRSFLESLYATDQKSKLQRGQIARAMVRDIGPR